MTRREAASVATAQGSRADGDERIGPRASALIEALQRRSMGHAGPVRRLLEARIRTLAEASADAAGAAGASAEADARPLDIRDARSSSPLSPLLEHIARAADSKHGASSPAAAHGAPLLTEMRRLCGEVRSESQLRQALEPSPADAGPLNSASLVHRALTLMRQASPGYLDAFLAHVDALASLEDMAACSAAGDGLAAGHAPPGRPRRKPGSRRPAAG